MPAIESLGQIAVSELDLFKLLNSRVLPFINEPLTLCLEGVLSVTFCLLLEGDCIHV